MITLRADNRVLSTNAKYSYLSTNYSSGIDSIIITNSEGFADDDYILLGEFGSETTEIVKVTTVTAATHTLALAANTKFSHSESTKVSIIRYNQVRFFHTDTATFSATDPVTAYVDIQADSTHSKGYDTTNTTGFGWFVFYNSTTNKATQASNAIPYAGFGENSVKKILDTFFSLLNNKEKKLITNAEAFTYLNEAYSIAQNELNLVNTSYTIDDEEEITTSDGTKEYALPANFSQLISIYNNGIDMPVSKIDVKNVSVYDDVTSNTTKYYLKSGYIGFSPTPTEVTIYGIRYRTKTTTLTSYYDNVDLPNNNFYCLIDFMLYRAAPKLSRSNADQFYKNFLEGIKRLKVTSIKQDSNLDSWSIDPKANA